MDTIESMSGEASPLQKLSTYRHKSGLYGWVGLVSGIVAYDVYAIKTRKIGTLTSAAHDLEGFTFGAGLAIWSGVTYHLFIEPRVNRWRKERRRSKQDNSSVG